MSEEKLTVEMTKTQVEQCIASVFLATDGLVNDSESGRIPSDLAGRVDTHVYQTLMLLVLLSESIGEDWSEFVERRRVRASQLLATACAGGEAH